MCGLSIPRGTESTHRGGDGKKPTLEVPFPGRHSEEATLLLCCLWGISHLWPFDRLPPTANSPLKCLPAVWVAETATQRHSGSFYPFSLCGCRDHIDSPFSQCSPQKSLSLLYILLSCTTPFGSQTAVSTSSTVSQRMAQALD